MRTITHAIDTRPYAPSYRSLAVYSAGAVAARAESLKEENSKYSALAHSHSFVPIAIETSGILGPQSLSFIKDLGNRIRSHSGDKLSFKYLLQRISMAVQRGNAISILDTLGSFS